MSERYKVLDNTQPNFVTLTLVGWVDLFIRPCYLEILSESLNYCVDNKGLKVHAYVFMTSHIHLVLSSNKNELPHIVRDFKKFTNKRLIQTITEQSESRREWLLNKFSFEAKKTGRAKDYKVWQDGFHPILLESAELIEQKVDYIHNNPIEAGFVFNGRDWINSSCSAYEEENDILSDVKLDRLW